MLLMSELLDKVSTKHLTAASDPDRRNVLARRIRLLVAATIVYNIVEAVIAITAGRVADSTALIGFGLDSAIEVSSAAAVAWQFSTTDHTLRERRERRTLKIIAFSFFALAIYVGATSIHALLTGSEAEHSTAGIIIAALSLVIMPALSYAERRAGRELGSATAVADSKQTLLCTYLSAVLLVGLLLNSAFGWSWADSAAALIIAVIALKEGINAWKGETCCSTPLDLDGDQQVDACCTTLTNSIDVEPVDTCCEVPKNQ